MQSIRQCVQRLVSRSVFNINKSELLRGALKTSYSIPSCNFHRSSVLKDEDKPTHFLDYNKTVLPPQKPDEERRPAYVCHMKANIKYSPKKMWYIAGFVRGMTIDEAVKQLSFLKKKGAAIAKDVILEAQRLAVEEHNVEFKSNLWVAESFATKGMVIKGMRRHARKRIGRVMYRYTHYFVRLEEGKPPKHYYLPEPKSGEELLQQWMEKMHGRKIPQSL